MERASARNEAVEASDATRVLAQLNELQQKLAKLSEPIVAELQQLLDSLHGQSFGLSRNVAFVEAVQQALARLGRRVRCPRCGKAAILRCRSTTTAKEGSFQFEHYTDGRQTNHGGGTTFPALQLTVAPPDKRKSRKKWPKR
jgi:hypothetical protein